MRLEKMWLICLLFVCFCSLASGLIDQAGAVVDEKAPAAAAVQEGENGGKEAATEEEPPGTFGPIFTDTAVPVDVGALELQPFWSYSFITGAYNHRGKPVSVGGNFSSFGFDLQITYGAWENLEVFTVIPVAVNFARGVEDVGPNGERNASRGGFGDVNLTAKYRFVKEGPVWPTISYVFAVDFPTGKYRSLDPRALGVDGLGAGSYAFTTGLNVSKWLKPFILYGNLYYTWPTNAVTDDGKVFPRDFITLNLAAEYPITKDNKWIALVEFLAYWDTNRMFGRGSNQGPSNLYSISPGLEFMATDKLSFAFGVKTELGGRNNDIAVTPILSMVWAVH